MYQGVLQGKIHELVTTLKANKGKVILYIDEIHRIFCEGNTHNNPKGNIAELLKPHIEEDVLIVGGTTPADMSQIPEDTAFLRRYEEFNLGPLTVDQCANILESFTNSPKFKQVYPTVAFSKVHFEAIVELTNLTINPNDPKCVVQPSVSIKFLETIAKKIRRDKLDKVTVELFAQVFGEYFQKAIASHRVNQQQLIALGEKYMHLFLADH